MRNDRLRVPIDAPYLHALGLAVICFGRLEWDAVWCLEKLQPGYVHTVGKKTAGQIANDLVASAATCADPVIADSLGAVAAEFKGLVDVRNGMMHANPGTSPGGEQRLFRHGSEWTITMIDDAADAFAAAGSVLNHHLHHLL